MSTAKPSLELTLTDWLLGLLLAALDPTVSTAKPTIMKDPGKAGPKEALSSPDLA
ncbi:hypothetical protein [Paenibacillus sp. OAS669]|uniref:hypothetical protein n=1 Tax=Paenibacillus sp. OAS669 TaxID=2663821 RepID=UPI00178B8E81|nr:hypothetical protein [Paenibacillus sp. OAS669]MBE1443635.1 hypothetical protein [Paenibacillus sp. OAS669]